MNQLSDTLRQTLNLFNKHKSVPEVAYRRKLAVSTIFGHIQKLISFGLIDINDVVDKETQDKIMKVTDAKSLREMKDRLPEDIRYDEIRCVLIANGKLKIKRKSKIERIVNWYYGNYCTRKCFDDIERQKECYDKLHLFAEKNKGLDISHREFLRLFEHMNICKLDPKTRRKYVSWQEFEKRWSR